MIFRSPLVAFVASVASVPFPHPMLKRLAHLCLKTSRLEEMAVFYRDQLGATVKFRYRRKDGMPIGYYFAFGEMSFIEVFDMPMPTAAVNQPSHWNRSKTRVTPGWPSLTIFASKSKGSMTMSPFWKKTA